MFHPSKVYLSREALFNNIRFLQNLIGPDVRFSSVIKGNAYGHGIEEFIPVAEEAGVRHFAVFNAHEALRAQRTITQGSQLMIMGMIDNDELNWAIENDVEFFVFDLDRLNAALESAKQVKKPAKIHLELETGLNRTGFYGNNFRKAMDLLQKEKEHFELEGVCTHYAGAEHIGNYLRVKQQIKTFKQQYKRLVKRNLIPKYRHTACSAAALSYPETKMDMVRFGIAQYGFWPSRETYIEYCKKVGDRAHNPLQRIISWKSKIMSTKNVAQGEFIGYGTSYMASKDMTIATIPVGYANGFARNLSNVGRVLVHGIRVPVIATVNMNMMMIDATEIPDVKKDDEVVLIGEQGELHITVASFGEMSNQLNYELLTRLPLDIPRQWAD